MPKRQEIDNIKLIKAVQDGLSTKDIKEAFGFTTSSQVKMAYLNAAMEQGIVPEIKDGRIGSKAEQQEPTVNKRGSLIIPKETITQFGFNVGDTFIIRRTKAGISLKQTNLETTPESGKPVVKLRKKNN